MKKLLTIIVLLASISTVYAANNFGYGIQLSKNENDLLIENIIPNSLAEKMGLKPGQKIIKLNGKKIQKLKISDIENLDNSYKNLQLIMSNNKQYKLKPENIDLLKIYNDIQDTYNTNTAYPTFTYKTDKIILPTDIDSKHVKYTNAYFNYADIISNKNAKLYTELFKVTQENVVKSIIDAQNNPMNEYAELYNSIYSADTQNYDIYGNAFKDFLRLAIYNEQNKEVIDRQISEFNNTQRKQYAQLAYNTRIVANLYSYANRELGLYLINNTINANQTDKWRDELKTQNKIYNKMYNELLQSLSKNKIEINKPGPLSNREQIIVGVTPKEKWVNDKQIIILAQERGYDPNRNPNVKKINDLKILTQKIASGARLSIEDYSEYLKLDPNNADIYYERGLLYSEQRKYTLAINDFDKVIQLSNNYGQKGSAYLHRGHNFIISQNNYANAYKDYEKAAECFEMADDPDGVDHALQFMWELKNNPKSFKERML